MGKYPGTAKKAEIHLATGADSDRDLNRAPKKIPAYP
jgi:hypothetical protein